MIRRTTFRRWIVVLILLLAALPECASPVAARQILLAHLPSAPVENPTRLAEAIETLAGRLSADATGLTLEVEIFRRYEDAASFLDGHREEIAVVLAEPSFFLGLADPPRPTHIGRVDGETVSRRLIVGSAVRAEFVGLADLRGGSLAVADVAGASTTKYLERSIFDGEMNPATWFGELRQVVDDGAAVAEVLFGGSDAALVDARHPSLRQREDALRIVWTGPSVPLPILALRDGTLTPPRRRALDQIVGTLALDAAEVLETLGLDGFERLADTTAIDLLEPAGKTSKRFEVALPPPFGEARCVPALCPSAPPSAGELLFEIAPRWTPIPLPESALPEGETMKDRDSG